MSRHHTANWSAADSRTWRKRIAASLPQPCTKCGREVDTEDQWQVDHITPLSQGGTKTSDNLGPAHRGCNARHGATLTHAIARAKSAAAQRMPQGWGL